MKNNKGRILQIVVTGASLFGLLAYTFVHTGETLARYIHPAFVGYICAFGIELAIVSLAVRIGDLKKSGQNAGFFYLVLVATLIVSAIANIAEGFTVNQGVSLSVTTMNQVDVVQATIGLSATGLIPLIVFALSEIIGTDVTQAARAIEKERKAEINKMVSVLEQANDLDGLTRDERLSAIVNILADTPNPNKTQLANIFDISRTVLYEDLHTLADTGRIVPNGKGYKVAQ